MKHLSFFAVLLFLGVGCSAPAEQSASMQQQPVPGYAEETDVQENVLPPRVDLSTADPSFRFSAAIPAGWQIEYVPTISSLNLYDPTAPQETNRDKSQIFIRQFTANEFLTLDTVEILSQEETTVGVHDAVQYHIVKKPGVPDFVEQPFWRNQEHRLIDIRFSKRNPSVFYVFAYHPQLDVAVFEEFIDSIEFHNDRSAFVAPMDMFKQRIMVKPFGLYVEPGNSPVSPERFQGYHNASDLEVFEDELEQDVRVVASCGGMIQRAGSVGGYGGLVVQECLLEDNPLAVMYGHVNVNSLRVKVGQYVRPGQQIGVLGDHESDQTDGERKHLHFAFYKKNGRDVDIRGYVPRESQLSGWIDPQDIIQ